MWREVVQILLPTLATVAVRASTSGLQSAYEIIRSYLIYMENENSYAIKERYTVVKYMQTFSRLSRSMILKILAQLKIGGFIEMENGKLIRINKNYQKNFNSIFMYYLHCQTSAALESKMRPQDNLLIL